MKQPKKTTSLAPKVLTEIEELDKIKPYLNALENAILSDEINNIALTGAYGSGKSTIIKTFQHQNPNFNFLNISLATFRDEGIEGDRSSIDLAKPENIKNSKINRLIELSILQQIFYHVEPSEIPDSRFKRIRSISREELSVFSIGIVLWTVSIIILFKENYLALFNPKTWTFALEDIDLIALIVITIFLFGIGLASAKITRLLNRSKINKLNIFNGEIEIGNSVDKSIFNQHLDEILYFFESTSYNVIVIEDLDRFKNTEVFTKLREINLLLNNSKLIKRKIAFIYAIRDDIFQNEERTKFFDYIIPVIPFISPTNANEQLSRLLKDAGLEHDFTEDFKDGVVTFIDDIDMRFLTNIFHEYTIYKESLGGNKLIQDNLFAIIIYKNLYPKDFVELSKNKGKLFDFFRKKHIYIDKLISDIDFKINAIETEISNIEGEQIANIRELRAIYINAIQSKIPKAVDISIEGRIYNFFQLNDKDVFEELLDLKSIQYYWLRPYSGNYKDYTIATMDMPFSEIEQFVNGDFTFRERESLIKDRDDHKVEKLKAEKKELKERRNEIKTWDARKVFEVVEIDPYLADFVNSNLMRNLLLNGYIDENYHHYISQFHAVNITQADYDFERNVKKGFSSAYNYELNKIRNVVKKIPTRYFERRPILNYDLLAFLLTNSSEFKEKFEAFIKLLTGYKYNSKDGYEMFSFIKGYLFEYEVNQTLHKGFSNKNTGEFVKVLTKEWPKFWSCIETYSNLPKADVLDFFQLILKFADIDDIITNALKSQLKTFISKDSDILSSVEGTEHQKVVTLFQKLNIKFITLSSPNIQTRALFDAIYESNHYIINDVNVEVIYKLYNEEEGENNYYTSNYSAIQNSNLEILKNYINSNINDYLKNVFLKIETNDSETEETVVDFLNNAEINAELIIRIVRGQKIKITNLANVKEAYNMELLFEYNKIKHTWANVFTYYTAIGDEVLSEVLISYLNSEEAYLELSKFKLDDEIKAEEVDIDCFTLDIVLCNKLTYESYNHLMNSTTYTYDNLRFENLSSDKVQSLIKHGKLIFSESNFKRMKEHYSELYLSFVEQNQVTFISEFDKLSLNEKEILAILSSNNISEKIKLEFIYKIDEDIIKKDKKISSLYCAIKARNNDIKSIPIDLAIVLFENSDSIEDRIKILNLHFWDFSKTDLEILIGKLPKPYNKIAQKRKKPSISNTKDNLELIRSLDNIDFISSFEIDGANINIVARYSD
ncbi:YobI family P-loop NTPase [Arenibacter troitsensis]|uniref:YobI-like P-loop NTPase domain-containing protein n=1 Tax=Arenibacter troitsensis TaxID=188872 RepID=A0A1X7L812_9FLAO|nr:hypothetical protein [Arenibacter troitsensis]SMG49697.1 hypothetical protein SAMN03080602_03860 [Arenibacter troitsensis]